MKVKVINQSGNKLPQYQTGSSAGLDLRAFLENPITIKPLGRQLISTGIYMELPKGFEAQVRPRSGMALKHGITVLNSPGTIDADYRGEVKVLLINLSEQDYAVKNGDRIAQMIIAKHETIAWDEVKTLETSERGAGGYGHTGTL